MYDQNIRPRFVTYFSASTNTGHLKGANKIIEDYLGHSIYWGCCSLQDEFMYNFLQELQVNIFFEICPNTNRIIVLVF